MLNKKLINKNSIICIILTIIFLILFFAFSMPFVKDYIMPILCQSKEKPSVIWAMSFIFSFMGLMVLICTVMLIGEIFEKLLYEECKK
jgi:hypothetical protein